VVRGGAGGNDSPLRNCDQLLRAESPLGVNINRSPFSPALHRDQEGGEGGGTWSRGRWQVTQRVWQS
jgi:hypothetical protein